MKTAVPIQKSIKFFIRIFPAFLARQNPHSSAANPACMKNTSAAPIRNHMPKTSDVTDSVISSIMLFVSMLG